eukprot:GEMP01046775.1.p2 GENE.GEMP01046775.1~~GEMP01046775.1.p2  ORF type:complete len:147 (+),score=34.47 GEMP01046775.1:43-483(+)
MTSVNAKQKLDFQRSTQFDRDYWAPADDGYSTNTAAQNKEVEHYIQELKEIRENVVSKDPEVLAIAKECAPPPPEKICTAAERGRRDNVANIFQIPKLRPDESTNMKVYVDHNKDATPPNKKYFMKRDRQTEYYECYVQYKHTMRT